MASMPSNQGATKYTEPLTLIFNLWTRGLYHDENSSTVTAASGRDATTSELLAGFTPKYLSDAAAAAVTSLLSSWVDDDFALSVEDVSIRCRQVVEGILTTSV